MIPPVCSVPHLKLCNFPNPSSSFSIQHRFQIFKVFHITKTYLSTWIRFILVVSRLQLFICLYYTSCYLYAVYHYHWDNNIEVNIFIIQLGIYNILVLAFCCKWASLMGEICNFQSQTHVICCRSQWLASASNRNRVP